ncbi:MAG: HNH endonuclease signature motif containing protein [Pseudomonadota bacterium]
MSTSARPAETPLFQALWRGQAGRCALCGEPMPAHRFETAHATIWKKRRPTFDHIRAKALGGSDAEDNLQLAHAECNWRKGRG